MEELSDGILPYGTKGGDWMKITDKDRLDFLQRLTDRAEYTGGVICRKSTTGRGWRLHETSHPQNTSSVRDAIDRAIIRGIDID
jgi:hypothetical protein